MIPILVLGQKEPRNWLLERLFASPGNILILPFAEVLVAGALLVAVASGVKSFSFLSNLP